MINLISRKDKKEGTRVLGMIVFFLLSRYELRAGCGSHLTSAQISALSLSSIYLDLIVSEMGGGSCSKVSTLAQSEGEGHLWQCGKILMDVGMIMSHPPTPGVNWDLFCVKCWVA